MRSKNRDGFTLLEVMIAIAIIAIGMGAIISAEHNSLDISYRSKRMITVAMLAKNAMTATERDLNGKSFTEVKDEDEGKFDNPYQDYSWKRKIKRVEFPNLQDTGEKTNEDQGQKNQEIERVFRLATNYLSKASREVTVTIKWKDKGQNQEYSTTQYWVDLKHEFSLSEQ